MQKYFVIVLLTFISFGCSRGLEDALNLPVLDFDDSRNYDLFLETQDEIWRQEKNEEQKEEWNQIIRNLCENNDLILEDQLLDCENIIITPKLAKATIKKRDVSETVLEEGSGDDITEDSPIEEKKDSEILTSADSAPVDSTAVETVLAESAPPETASAEAAPAESVLANSTAVEKVPAETAPAESVPAETSPTESVPAETAPAESVPPETAPAVPTNSTVVETVSAESEPVPAESEPVPAESEPAPAESEPAPAESKAIESGPEDLAPKEALPESVPINPTADAEHVSAQAPTITAEEKTSEEKQKESMPEAPTIKSKEEAETVSGKIPISKDEDNKKKGSDFSNDKKERKLTQEDLNDKQSGNAIVDTDLDLADTESSLSKTKSNESIKVGESTEPDVSKDNKILITLFVAVLAVGLAAFSYNYIKRRKNNNSTPARIVNDVAKSDPEEGREMKPLMISPEQKINVEYKDEK